MEEVFHLMGTGMVLLTEQVDMEVVMDLWEVMEGWVGMVE